MTDSRQSAVRRTSEPNYRNRRSFSQLITQLLKFFFQLGLLLLGLLQRLFFLLKNLILLLKNLILLLLNLVHFSHGSLKPHRLLCELLNRHTTIRFDCHCCLHHPFLLNGS